MSQSYLTRRRFLQASAGLTATALLAACAPAAPQQTTGESGASDAAPAQQDVQLRLMLRGEYAGNLHREFADRFMQQNPGVTVALEETVYGDIFTKSLAMAAVNDLQDLVFGHNRWSYYLAYKNLFLDMDPLVEADENPNLMDIYYEDVISSLRGPGTEGKLFFLPDNIDVSPSAGVYINASLLEQSGLQVPTNRDWTYAELEEIVRTVARPAEGIYGYIGGNIIEKEGGIQAWTRGWGEGVEGSEDSWVLSADGTTFRLDGEAFPRIQEALQWYWNLANDGVAATAEAVAGVEGGADALFNSGRVAIRINDSSDTFNLQEMVGDKFEWAAIPKPLGPYGNRGSCIEANCWSINARTEHPDLSFELIKMLTGEDAARWTAQNLDRAPLGIKAVWNDPEIQSLNILWASAATWLDEGVDPYPVPANLRGFEFRDVIRNEMSEWYNAKETWEQMVAHAQPAIQEVLDMPLP